MRCPGCGTECLPDCPYQSKLDRATLLAEVERLQAEVERWQNEEVAKASCCWESEKEADSLRAKLDALVDILPNCGCQHAASAHIHDGVLRGCTAEVYDDDDGPVCGCSAYESYRPIIAKEQSDE